MLGLVLFNIFINDLEIGCIVKSPMFASDKLFQVARFQADGEELQEDLTKLSEWVWQG